MKIAMFYGDKPNTGQYDNGIWLDILKIPYIQKIEEAEKYDVIIRTMWIDGIGWSRELRQRYPHIIQIGLSDHPLSTHISKMSPNMQIAYLQDLEYVDAIMALTEEERQFYQTALPSKIVRKVGLPFPFDAYEAKYGKWRKSEKKYIGLGVGASDNDRNFLSSFLIFSRLKLEFPNIEGVFLSLPSQLIAPTAVYADNTEGIYLHERTGMDGFYDLLSQCKFVINMADRNTPGRLQGEAAFFEVPVVGSKRLELQSELYPQWAVSPYSLEDAVSSGRWILNNPAAAGSLAKAAHKKLEKYDYAASKRKFNKLLKDIKSRR